MKKQLFIIIGLFMLLIASTQGIGEMQSKNDIYSNYDLSNSVYDFSNMTNDELRRIINDATKELGSRNVTDIVENEDGWVVWDGSGIKLTVMHNFKFTPSEKALSIETIIENKTNNYIEIEILDAAINGWQVSNDNMFVDPTNPGRKKKRKRNIYLQDAGISTLEEMKTIEVSFRIYNYNTQETICETKTLVLENNGN